MGGRSNEPGPWYVRTINRAVAVVGVLLALWLLRNQLVPLLEVLVRALQAVAALAIALAALGTVVGFLRDPKPILAALQRLVRARRIQYGAFVAEWREDLAQIDDTVVRLTEIGADTDTVSVGAGDEHG